MIAIGPWTGWVSEHGKTLKTHRFRWFKKFKTEKNSINIRYAKCKAYTKSKDRSSKGKWWKFSGSENRTTATATAPTSYLWLRLPWYSTFKLLAGVMQLSSRARPSRGGHFTAASSSWLPFNPYTLDRVTCDGAGRWQRLSVLSRYVVRSTKYSVQQMTQNKHIFSPWAMGVLCSSRQVLCEYWWKDIRSTCCSSMECWPVNVDVVCFNA